MERREITVFRAGGETLCCPVCGIGSAMIRIEDAAAALDLDVGVLRQSIATGRLHGYPAGGGRTLVCINSMRGWD